jgi:hypothetical protein
MEKVIINYHKGSRLGTVGQSKHCGDLRDADNKPFDLPLGLYI